MEIKVAIALITKYLAPIVTKIIKSKISTIGKSLYEKLKKRIVCCDLGLNFFTKIHSLLDEVLPEYTAAVEEAKIKYSELTGEEIGGTDDD